MVSMDIRDLGPVKGFTKGKEEDQRAALPPESLLSSGSHSSIPSFGPGLVYGHLCIELFGSIVSIPLVVISSHAAQPLHLCTQANMPPRQCLLSRRGSVRGGSSKPPAEAPISHCCPCCCYRPAPANTLQPSNFLDSYSPSHNSDPLPAFDTAIFSLHSSKNKPCISAHVTVLFLEDEAKEKEDGNDKGKQ